MDLGSSLTKAAKQLRAAARQRSLERGEEGWGSPTAPPPVVADRVGDPARVVVVGAGIQGGVLARGVVALTGAELASVVDLDLERAGQLVERLGASGCGVHRDAADALAGGPVDLVVVATTAPSHLELGRRALEAGVPRILMEKPLATRLPDAQQFVADCTAAGTSLAVNHVRRWLVDHRAVLAAVRAGQIGTLRLMTAQIGAGELAMQGSHFIDLFRMFTGQDVVEVSADLRPSETPNVRGAHFDDPTGHVMLRAADGSRAYLDFEPDLPPRDIVITLRGDDGLIVIEEHLGVWTLRSRSGRIWTFPFAEPFSPATFAARSLTGVLTEAVPACGGDDGIAVLEVLLAAHHSQSSGGAAIRLPLSDQQRQLEVVVP